MAGTQTPWMGPTESGVCILVSAAAAGAQWQGTGEGRAWMSGGLGFPR